MESPPQEPESAALAEEEASGEPGAREVLAEEAKYLRERVDNLSRLMDVTLLISSSLDFDVVLNRVMELAKEVMHAEAGSVMLWNEELQCLEFTISVGKVGVEDLRTIYIKKGQGIAGTVVETGEPLLVADVQTDPRFYEKVDEETGFVTKSILAAPLVVKDKIIGVSEVLNHSSGRPFTNLDLELFVSFCRQVAIAIENARLHDSELRRHLIDQQMEMAASIQKSFLTTDLPRDEKGRFEVNAFTKSAHAVGGDLYCITRLPDGQLGIALGDVSGKGVPAALYMARMISEFRLFSAQSASVQEVVEKLNQALAQRSMRGMFVTFAYGTLAPDTGLLRMVNAGHLPPIRVGADGAVQPVAAAGGPPLGVVPGLSYQEQAVQLAPGDRILLYSDGILEARGVGGEEFGEQRILDVASSSKKGADGLLKGVLDAVKEFSSGTPQMDDMTLIAAAWTGKGE